MSSCPRMLAGFVQSSLGSIDELDRELGRRVRDRLKPQELEFIHVDMGMTPVSEE